MTDFPSWVFAVVPCVFVLLFIICCCGQRSYNRAFRVNHRPQDAVIAAPNNTSPHPAAVSGFAPSRATPSQHAYPPPGPTSYGFPTSSEMGQNYGFLSTSDVRQHYGFPPSSDGRNYGPPSAIDVGQNYTFPRGGTQINTEPSAPPIYPAQNYYQNVVDPNLPPSYESLTARPN